MTSNYYNNTIPAGTAQNPPEGTFGPHSTRLANAADPRVDSDRDGRAASAHSSTAAPTHTATTGTGLTSTAGPTGENTGERVARNIKGVVAQGHVRHWEPVREE